jgi:hypothetical protein
MDIRILATIIYLLLIFKTIKMKSNNNGILAGLEIIFYIPIYSLLYAIFWIIWLILN